MNYPVRIDVAARQERYNRAKTFFKYVLWFPQALIGGYGLAFVVQWAAFRELASDPVRGQAVDHHARGARRVARVPDAIQRFLLLLTEAHPRMLDVPRYQPPPDAPGLPPATFPAPGGRVPERIGDTPPGAEG